MFKEFAMARHILLLALIGVSLGVLTSSAPPSQAEQQSPEKKAVVSTAEIIQRLNKPISLPDRIDQPLGDALQHLNTFFDVPMIIDDAAFATDNQDNDVRSKNVKLDKHEQVRMSATLDAMLAQVQGAYLVKPDYILIVPRSRLERHVWGNMEALDSPDGQSRPRSPVVSAVFENTPLIVALKELANTTGNSVVLDRKRAAELGQAPVTATLLNVPLDTAVRILANQAELKMVSLDNVLYVTTTENTVTLRPASRQMFSFGLGSIPVAEAPK
jgi:hypothetical protein